MSESKFTKGEWLIYGERVGVVNDDDSQSYGMMLEVAFVDMYNFCTPECIANAHLIAAAPEMYEMLNRIANEPYGAEDVSEEVINKLLAKARGEPCEN